MTALICLSAFGQLPVATGLESNESYILSIIIMTDTLLSSPVTSDLDEREVAKAALEAAEEQLQSLCASHAGTFVSVERRGRAMQEALTDLEQSAKEVEAKIENARHILDQEEDSDKDTSLAVLSERHRVRRRTLLQHSSLLELLELPSLMDACVRSNLYEEALSIATFANTLERRHQDNNRVVMQVIAQIRSRSTDLRRYLLHRLKSSVTMPQCLEVVTALRRLNSIDLERQSEVNLERLHTGMELRLQVNFLEARDVWLDFNTRTPVGALPSSEQVLDAIERYRTRMFEVATQFNAIFRAQSQSTGSSSVSLLSMWMARRTRSFLELLSSELAVVEDAASLRDALEASVFFANSMGRLGADFTAQLPGLFEPKMLSIVEKHWKQGLQQFQDTLRVCREAAVASPLVSQTVESDQDASVDPSSLSGPLAPPRQLLALPPLARLVNAILTGLNELRRCLFPGIFAQLRELLEEVISEVQSDLLTNERLVMKPGFRGEAAQLREVAARFKSVFGEIVEPYLRGSVEAALGNDEGAACLHRIYLDAITEPEEGVPTVDDEKEDLVAPDEELQPQSGDSDIPKGEQEEIAKEEPVVEGNTAENSDDFFDESETN